jgi:hypothetical protein
MPTRIDLFFSSSVKMHDKRLDQVHATSFKLIKPSLDCTNSPKHYILQPDKALIMHIFGT